MTQEATREGVSPEVGEQQEYQPKERDNFLEELAARRAQEVAQENGEEAPEEEQPAPEAPTSDEIPTETTQPSQEEEEPEYEIKVDGVVQKVPLSKLIDAGKRTLQKESAADKRLEEASRLKAELERYKDWVATQQRTAQPTEQDAFQAKMNKWREAIQYGDAETANQAMIEYGKAIAAAAVQSALPEIHKSREEMEAERRVEAIRYKFEAPPEQGGFADIAADEEAMQIASALVDMKLRVEKKPNTWDTYAEVGELVRRMRGNKAPVAVDIKARQEKKRAAETVPAMSGRAAVPQEKEPTRQDIINEMMKSRAG